MQPLVNKGAKNDMKVSDENALKGLVSFPQKAEQIAISGYFDNLDNLITLHQRKQSCNTLFINVWEQCSLRPLAVANAFFNGRYAEQNGRSYLVDC